jgi:hypothetical protein
LFELVNLLENIVCFRFLLMSKSVLLENCREELLRRVNLLHPNSLPKWGKMTLNEMLLHCDLVTEAVLNSPEPTHSTHWKQVLAKYYFLYIKKDFPKMIKGPKRFDAKSKITTEEFLTLQENFTRTLKRFSELETKLTGYHPFFGVLSHTEWGIMVYKHTDHHLKQFGV